MTELLNIAFIAFEYDITKCPHASLADHVASLSYTRDHKYVNYNGTW